MFAYKLRGEREPAPRPFYNRQVHRIENEMARALYNKTEWRPKMNHLVNLFFDSGVLVAGTNGLYPPPTTWTGFIAFIVGLAAVRAVGSWIMFSLVLYYSENILTTENSVFVQLDEALCFIGHLLVSTFLLKMMHSYHSTFFFTVGGVFVSVAISKLVHVPLMGGASTLRAAGDNEYPDCLIRRKVTELARKFQFPMTELKLIPEMQRDCVVVDLPVRALVLKGNVFARLAELPVMTPMSRLERKRKQQENLALTSVVRSLALNVTLAPVRRLVVVLVVFFMFLTLLYLFTTKQAGLWLPFSTAPMHVQIVWCYYVVMLPMRWFASHLFYRMRHNIANAVHGLCEDLRISKFITPRFALEFRSQCPLLALHEVFFDQATEFAKEPEPLDDDDDDDDDMD